MKNLSQPILMFWHNKRYNCDIHHSTQQPSDDCRDTSVERSVSCSFLCPSLRKTKL